MTKFSKFVLVFCCSVLLLLPLTSKCNRKRLRPTQFRMFFLHPNIFNSFYSFYSSSVFLSSLLLTSSRRTNYLSFGRWWVAKKPVFGNLFRKLWPSYFIFFLNKTSSCRWVTYITGQTILIVLTKMWLLIPGNYTSENC